MGTPFNLVSRDAAQSLTEYSDEFRTALTLGEFTPWAAELGFVRTTNALRTVWPIPLDAAGYKELKGDIKFRRLYSRSMSMISKTWYDGVQEKAAIIEAPDFIGWGEQPAAMAAEWQRQPNEIVADLLAANSFDGPLLDLYKDPDVQGSSSTVHLFDEHPYNVLLPDLGTFDNRITCTEAQIASGEVFDLIDEHFRNIMAADGKKRLGLTLTGGKLYVPATRNTAFKNVLNFDTLIRTVAADGTINPSSGAVAAVTQNNAYKNTFGFSVADELQSQDYFYARAAGRPGLHPIVIQTKGAPEEILHDKSSEMYKRSLEVGVAYVGEMNAGAALPHSIVRVEITE